MVDCRDSHRPDYKPNTMSSNLGSMMQMSHKKWLIGGVHIGLISILECDDGPN